MRKLLELSDFNGQVLVQYKRKSNKQLKGVVVAIGAGIIGWSLCDNKDIFKKDKAIDIALRRALAAKAKLEEGSSNFWNCYDKIPQSLFEILEKIEERSDKYFKENKVMNMSDLDMGVTI